MEDKFYFIVYIISELYFYIFVKVLLIDNNAESRKYVKGQLDKHEYQGIYIQNVSRIFFFNII